MAAVADTNVLVSYFLNRQSSSGLAFRRLTLHHRLLMSRDTLDELRDVLFRQKFDRVSLELRQSFIDEYQSGVDIIEPRKIIKACRDPKDDKFLSLAVSGKAHIILTGDNDLLVLHPFQGIDIVSPTEYLARSVPPPETR
jgi:putative PIN family toxin of toxin-antitoxin system